MGFCGITFRNIISILLVGVRCIAYYVPGTRFALGVRGVLFGDYGGEVYCSSSCSVEWLAWLCGSFCDIAIDTTDTK